MLDAGSRPAVVRCGTLRAQPSSAGHPGWQLRSDAADQRRRINLKIPKLRRQTFETAIIERYRRRESSVEESLIEMYLAGISVRRVEDITEALWGTRVSPSTVSNLNKNGSFVPAAICVMQPILPAAITSGRNLSIVPTLRSRSGSAADLLL